jgi:hypothetical protein
MQLDAEDIEVKIHSSSYFDAINLNRSPEITLPNLPPSETINIAKSHQTRENYICICSYCNGLPV